ncbi:MAG: hypothetical protein ACREVA_00065 [Burkholderiales bacterium]
MKTEEGFLDSLRNNRAPGASMVTVQVRIRPDQYAKIIENQLDIDYAIQRALDWRFGVGKHTGGRS